jgi:hypothetical protein
MKRWMQAVAVIGSLVALLTPVQLAYAQTISGTVSTPIGVRIPGVTVSATRTLPFQRETDTTDVEGDYSIGNRLGGDLDGTYNVQATASGYTFTPASTNVTIARLGSSVTVNFFTPATAPTITTSNAINIAVTNATLQGLVRPNGATTRVWFDYGVTTSYGSRSQSIGIGNGNLMAYFSTIQNGLLPGTTYHFRFAASNSFGVSYGEDKIFTTLSGIPSVTTLIPSNGSARGMRLNGLVNPNGAGAISGWFEYGPTTNYGNVTAVQNLGSGTNALTFNQLLVGLASGTTYHGRAGAATSFGTKYGDDVLFTPSFEDIAAALPSDLRTSAAWGDYDNDGKLDILLPGTMTTSAMVWRNMSNSFGAVSNFTGALAYGAMWGDVDNDGRLDVLSAGRAWRNHGQGFDEMPISGIAGENITMEWADFDQDGRVDMFVAVSGFGLLGLFGNHVDYWRNTPAGFQSAEWLGWSPYMVVGVAAADSNNDDSMDLAAAGTLYIEAGTGFRVLQDHVEALTVLVHDGAYQGHTVDRPSVAWADYNNDGWLDLIVAAGNTNANSVITTTLWRNTNDGFIDANVELPKLATSCAAWGDFDNDGRADLLLAGRPISGTAMGPPVTQLWRNTPAGFVNINAGLPGVSGWADVANAAAAFGDYDSDGRLDILLTGTTNGSASGWISRVFKNHFPRANTAPGGPHGLTVTVTSNMATLTWNAATDAETPAAGLTYNVRVGTTPGGCEIISPLSHVTGGRQLPKPGNSYLGLTAKFRFTEGTPYYWSVQAIDSAFAGSPFAPEQNFKMLRTEPRMVSATTTNIIIADTDGDAIVSAGELQSVLANYWANNPWLQMTNPAKLSDGFFQFALTNEAVWNFSVDVTTNFTDWNFLGPAFPVYQFFDPASTNDPQRYYRLRWP